MPVRFVAAPGYTGPRRIQEGVPTTPPPGYRAVGPTRPSFPSFVDYLEAKSRGIYDPGYRDWVNGVGRVTR